MIKRSSFIATFVAIGLVSAVAAADLDSKLQFHIPAQTLSAALFSFADQAGIQVMTATADLTDIRSPGVSGERTAREALGKILEGTGLNFRAVSDNAVTIEASGRTGLSQAADSQWMGQGGLMVAQQESASNVDSAQGTSAPIRPEDAKQDPTAIGEIVVTAQKREERLIDVPQSVTVLSSEALHRLGATQFRDFANTVPGLSFNTAGAGFNQISLRGVLPTISSTVAIYVDEVPYGSSSAFTQSNHYSLDVGLFDLDRIEVLRGPQGTLYGASSMGGLLKYVTKQPDLNRFSGGVRAGASTTRAGEMNYDGSVSINAPIVADKLAVRASGFYSRDGGYIDNLALNKNNVNRSDVYGGRADLLFVPTDALSVRITGFVQDISRDGWATADYNPDGTPIDASTDQRRFYDEPFDQRFRLISGTVAYDMGLVSLTSISSYQTVRTEQFWDFKHLIPGFAVFGPFSAIGLPTELTTDNFTQEVRLTAKRTGPLEWLIGGFYSHQNSGNKARFVQRDLAGQPSPILLSDRSSPSKYEEYAAFGNLTWYLTDKFDVSGGARYARNRQRFGETVTGLFARVNPSATANDDVATYLANARYRFSDQATGYVRYATGYRAGGPNFAVVDQATGQPIPLQPFEADRSTTYEVGIKAETFDRRFGIDVAGYYTDWDNMQIAVLRGGFAVFGNAPGGATVQGGELTLTVQPASGFTATGAFSYQNATLSAADPDLGGAKDERLPFVPRVTAAINADYELPVASNFQPTIGATVRHVGERKAAFGSAAYRMPDYETIDLRTSIALNEVSVQLYVHNLFDDRGPLSVLPTSGARVAILQPRTIGVQLQYSFD